MGAVLAGEVELGLVFDLEALEIDYAEVFAGALPDLALVKYHGAECRAGSGGLARGIAGGVENDNYLSPRRPPKFPGSCNRHPPPRPGSAPSKSYRPRFACSPSRFGCYRRDTLAFTKLLNLKQTTYAEPVDWKR